MTGNDQFSEQLTSKQYQLIELLLAGVNVAAAARQLNIGDKTARRWLALPRFQAAYTAAQQAIFDETLSELKAGMRDVVAALKCHINATVEPTPASQVAAMKLWSELATKAAADSATGDQDYAAYDMRVVLSECSPDELAVITPILKAIAARKAEIDTKISPIRKIV